MWTKHRSAWTFACLKPWRKRHNEIGYVQLDVITDVCKRVNLGLWLCGSLTPIQGLLWFVLWHLCGVVLWTLICHFRKKSLIRGKRTVPSTWPIDRSVVLFVHIFFLCLYLADRLLLRFQTMLDRGYRFGSTLRRVVHKQQRLTKDSGDGGQPKLRIIVSFWTR